MAEHGQNTPVIEAGIRKMLQGEEIDMKTWIAVYTAVHNSITQPVPCTRYGADLAGEELYLLLAKMLHHHLANLQRSLNMQQGEKLLDMLNSEWERYTCASRAITRILRYFETHWIRKKRDESKPVLVLHDLCMQRWIDDVLEPMHARAMREVLQSVERQRNGGFEGFSRIRNFVYSFIFIKFQNPKDLDRCKTKPGGLALYKERFEKPLLEATYDFFQRESTRILAERGVLEYTEWAELKLNNEQSLVPLYLLNGILAPMISTCERALVKDHLDALRNGFRALFGSREKSHLFRLHGLLARVPGALDPLHAQFEAQVQSEGLANMANIPSGEDDLDPRVFVSTLHASLSPFKQLVSGGLAGDAEFERRLENACRKVVNENTFCRAGSYKSAEIVAEHANLVILELSRQNPAETEIDASLEMMMTVFNYIIDKDVFEKLYCRHFAKRILHSNTSLEHVERAMISKFMQACEARFATTLQRMLHDMTKSRELDFSFKKRQDTRPDFDASFYVLHQGSWPFSPSDITFAPPTSVSKTCEQFNDFYNSKHQGQKLTWLWQLCKGELQANYLDTDGKVPRIFKVSAYQMAILLLFNDSDALSSDQMAESTRLPTKTLETLLAGLVKSKVLNRQTRQDTTDVCHHLNHGLKSARAKINLNITIKSKKKNELESTRRMNMEHRKLLTQCTIVRIIKSRQKMIAHELISEAAHQLISQFQASIPAVKGGIDVLVDKEFLRRLPDDHLEYVA